ncbi:MULTISPECIES: glycosyltransferase family 4 protein [unclassified Bradyrhizobium]|uniref:glycosyltransferase family 4 protein n=1 Tax=unclassified Bradyrhizobium TaxID=2631580 RepID=UPI001BAA4B0E|nr:MULTISPECIES: glycosyltransferase [unclassified Bradyrhizobium]MBR1207647.1 glycosyltransferase [Bradyrhizobium sp. AUGA SZCCT0124]MBR1317030.1 glycosyltransferase [Bradyrhizobium sp. AUGA SZCCT0051]MBR1345506.1 glycosyltransferase [Bradyrhizobium sp. AUGA SZCCT0105]MBR1360142.1 glycosyltransferase [Bradyrhizobium sp. AUGA SZCCT0045]
MTLVQKDRDSEFQLQLAFLREFQRAHNRPLRVLHIGNIANNAYNNALIQRRFGIESDVICYNYYHVMGCPEWEAASFDGNVDNMFPDWWATELGGWRRPDWFAQGPVLDCLSYLRAKNAGDGEAAAFFWTLLQARYWEMLDGIAAAESRVRPPMPEHLVDTISIAREFQDFQSSKAIPQPLDQPTIVLPGATIGPESALSPISSASSKLASPDPRPGQSRSLANEYPNPEGPGRLVSTYRSLLAKYVFVHLRREAETGVVAGASLAVAIWRSQRRSRGLPRFGFEFSADVFTMPNPDTAPPAASEGNQYRTFRGSRSSSPKGPSRLVSIYRSLLTKYVFAHLRREAETGVVDGSSLAVAIWRNQRRSRGLPRFGFEFPADAFTTPNPDTATPAAGESNEDGTSRDPRSPNPQGPSRLTSIYRSLLTKYVFAHLRREAETGAVARPSFAVAIWRSQRRSRGLPRYGFEFPADAFTIPDPDAATPVASESDVLTIPNLDIVTPAASNGAAADVGSSGIAVVTQPDIVDRPEFRYFERYGKGEDRNASQRAARLGDLLRQFTDYPAEALVLVEAFASSIANEFADVLEHYDIIQGYSIDGFIPFINGLKNYTCYEHGTLREMPFEKTYNGILCSASYKNAAFSFVTNSDVLPSVARLKLKRERTVYLPHAFDDEKISSFRAGLKIPKRDPKVTTFFSPTRHHWHAAPVSMQKGNDLFLRAAAQVAQADRDFRIILVEWGVDVYRSKELIQELRIEDMVSWIPSLNKAELRQRYCASDVVVDQFRIPAIGGVTFEAMALGRRVITNLDETQSAEFFGAAPPCLVADSVESCAARILEVLADPLDGNGRGDAARLWFEKCHSAQRVVALQLAAYRTICAA